MINKDKRSLLLSFVIADGCLHYIKNGGKLYGGITIGHGPKQIDYLSWKSAFISQVIGRELKVRGQRDRDLMQISFCMKRMRSWRKFCYPGNRKSIPKILKFIEHPEFALMIMLMDDGYVETSGARNGAKFRLYFCDQTSEELELIRKWFVEKFDTSPTVKFQKNSHRNKTYPYLKFTQDETLKMWALIREKVLTIESMKYKFRYVENTYRLKSLQPPATQKKS